MAGLITRMLVPMFDPADAVDCDGCGCLVDPAAVACPVCGVESVSEPDWETIAERCGRRRL